MPGIWQISAFLTPLAAIFSAYKELPRIIEKIRKMLEKRAESPKSGVSMKAQSDMVAVGRVFGYAAFVQ